MKIEHQVGSNLFTIRNFYSGKNPNADGPNGPQPSSTLNITFNSANPVIDVHDGVTDKALLEIILTHWKENNKSATNIAKLEELLNSI